MPAIDAAAAGSWAGTGILLDARAGERYRGEFEPVDPRAGHIPGPSAPRPRRTLTSPGGSCPPRTCGAASRGWAFPGTSPVAVYCGSGVTAAHEVAALEIAGIRAALYPGSFSEWSNNPALPVATGSQPG